MAKGGSDYEMSDMSLEDSDRDETLDPSRFSVGHPLNGYFGK